MKLRKLHIEDYKMFKDFDISFVDENDEALPIIVLTGVNGSGKTTLLEYLGKTKKERELLSSAHYKTIDIKENDCFEFIDNENTILELTLDKPMRNFRFYANNIIYFLSGIDDTKKVADEFVKTFYDFLKNKDYRPSEVKEHFHRYMVDIFEGLDLTFSYSHLDKEDNVWFVNGEGVEFRMDQLSTGEKTLLSKILYIYFKDYKDKVILIDEPELSLHPSWQNKILSVYERLAEKNNCQIIIATHSPHIIGSAKPEYIRVLKKIDDKIEVAKYTQSYGMEFNKILTDIMGANTRVSEVSDRLSELKSMIVQEKFDSEEFQEIWMELEKLIGADNIDLRLLKLEIASRKKNAQNK